MSNELTTNVDQTSPFDAMKHVDDEGNDFWYARELMKELEYGSWQKFTPVLKRAIKACRNTGQRAIQNFIREDKIQNIGNRGGTREIEDYRLTRHACYLVAMNGDPFKEPVSLAQTYFAQKTMLRELDEKRQVKQISQREYENALTEFSSTPMVTQQLIAQMAESFQRMQEMEVKLEEIHKDVATKKEIDSVSDQLERIREELLKAERKGFDKCWSMVAAGRTIEDMVWAPD